MPIYEYACEACGERFDKLVRSLSQEATQAACPACQSTETRRLISAPAVHTAGEGGASTKSEGTASPKPPVFGRKELNKALKNKGT